MTDSVSSSGPLAFVTASATDKTAAFRAASRHSSRVRLMRRLTFATAVLTTFGVIGFAVLDPFHRVAGLSVDHVSIDGTSVTMSHAKLAGYHADGRPYEIFASSAVQDVKSPNVFQLHDLDAHLTMADRTITHVTSRLGTYDSTHETMNLTTEVHITSDSGLDLRTRDAHVEFKTGAVVTNNPVTVALKGSSISADSMKTSDGLKHVMFDGHVHSVFVPEPDTASPTPQAAEANKP